MAARRIRYEIEPMTLGNIGARWLSCLGPQFRDAMLSTHPNLTAAGMEAAQAYNFERYHYQGIGRYEPAEAYHRGIADLTAVASLIGEDGFAAGPKPVSTDAGIYGFVANIYYYDIDPRLFGENPGLRRPNQFRFRDSRPRLASQAARRTGTITPIMLTGSP
jgi:hypothetical protein